MSLSVFSSLVHGLFTGGLFLVVALLHTFITLILFDDLFIVLFGGLSLLLRCVILLELILVSGYLTVLSLISVLIFTFSLTILLGNLSFSLLRSGFFFISILLSIFTLSFSCIVISQSLFLLLVLLVLFDSISVFLIVFFNDLDLFGFLLLLGCYVTVLVLSLTIGLDFTIILLICLSFLSLAILFISSRGVTISHLFILVSGHIAALMLGVLNDFLDHLCGLGGLGRGGSPLAMAIGNNLNRCLFFHNHLTDRSSFLNGWRFDNDRLGSGLSRGFLSRGLLGWRLLSRCLLCWCSLCGSSLTLGRGFLGGSGCLFCVSLGGLFLVGAFGAG